MILTINTGVVNICYVVGTHDVPRLWEFHANFAVGKVNSQECGGENSKPLECAARVRERLCFEEIIGI